MGIGLGAGENRANEAANAAIDNPLLEGTAIEGATRFLVNVSGSEDLSLVEFQDVVNIITAKADPDAEIISGTSLDPSLGDKLRVTVIATGFQSAGVKAASAKKEAPRQENAKTGDSDNFINFRDWESMRGQQPKQPNYASRNSFQDEDIEIPTVIRDRKYNLKPDVRLQGKEA
jgi:cell division protein FtsZ